MVNILLFTRTLCVRHATRVTQGAHNVRGFFKKGKKWKQ